MNKKGRQSDSKKTGKQFFIGAHHFQCTAFVQRMINPGEMSVPPVADGSILSISDSSVSHVCLSCYDECYNLWYAPDPITLHSIHHFEHKALGQSYD